MKDYAIAGAILVLAVAVIWNGQKDREMVKCKAFWDDIDSGSAYAYSISSSEDIVAFINSISSFHGAFLPEDCRDL